MIDEKFLKLCVNITNVEFMRNSNIKNDGSSPENENSIFVARIDMNKKGRFYDYNHGQIAFMTEDGNYYTSPFVEELIPVLEESGFTRGAVVVPFSADVSVLNLSVANQWRVLVEEKNELEKQKRATEETNRHR